MIAVFGLRVGFDGRAQPGKRIGDLKPQRVDWGLVEGG
jgi:hypothetical protein